MDRHRLTAHVRHTCRIKSWISIAAAGAATLYLLPAQAQTLSNFGQASASGATPAVLEADFKRASRVTLTESATVQSICAYVDGNGGTFGQQQVQYALYTNVNGAPGRKVFETTDWGVNSGTAARWICRGPSYLPVIAPGQYWITVISSFPGGIVRGYSGGTTQNVYSNADDYTDGPAESFGSATVGTGTLAAYVRYYPQSQMRSAGRTTIGTIPSAGMSANFKRVSSFVMPEAGKIHEIAAYTDGRGSTNPENYQRYRYIIYKDANGVPGDLVYESGNHFLKPGGSRPSWINEQVHLNDPRIEGRPVLGAGRYWLGILSGGILASGSGQPTDTGGVARYFYDHTGSWYGNDDQYSDRASTPFGAGTAKGDTISAYISYRPPSTITADTLGRTDISTDPSSGLDPNVIRWSQFMLRDQNATLTGLHAYLDGRGATGGSQDVRMVLYQYNRRSNTDGSFVDYFTKIAASEVVTIAAGMSPRWVDFSVPQVAMPLFFPTGGTSYLIGIQSGGPGSVARAYADNRLSNPDLGANWSSHPDTFADGAIDEFRVDDPATRQRVTLSVYASYSLPPP